MGKSVWYDYLEENCGSSGVLHLFTSSKRSPFSSRASCGSLTRSQPNRRPLESVIYELQALVSPLVLYSYKMMGGGAPNFQSSSASTRSMRLPRGKGSPIEFSTTVPLTLAVPKPTLLWIEHCLPYRISESLSKQWEGRVCIDS